MFTPEETNALLIMVSESPIKGKDSHLVAGILDKLKAEQIEIANEKDERE